MNVQILSVLVAPVVFDHQLDVTFTCCGDCMWLEVYWYVRLGSASGTVR